MDDHSMAYDTQPKPSLEESQRRTDEAPPYGERASAIDRRTFLMGTGIASAGLLAFPAARRLWHRPQPVFIAKGQAYDGRLARTLRDGLSAVEFPWDWIRGRKVLLKPNLVEPCRTAPQITTHPAMVLAAASVFRQAGATVSVGEAPAHLRDSEMMLVESGVDDALRGEALPFADLNYSEVRAVPNVGKASKLEEIRFPREVLEADLVVSLAKLKTHHWVGLTASMKNLYGLLPGSIYGWPKNVLHYAGIPQTVVDIVATAPRSIAIVDAILCAEGDGPLSGTPKPMGLVAVGQNLPAVDAILARIMGLDPRKVPYLEMAEGKLGPIAEDLIVDRGEPWAPLVSPFRLLEVPYLQAMRAT